MLCQMMTTTQLMDPNLSLSTTRGRRTRVFENLTIPESGYAISTSVNVDSFPSSGVATNGRLPDITDANIADLLSLVVQFKFIQLLRQTGTRDLNFPVGLSATCNRGDVPELIPVAIPPGRSEDHSINLTHPLRSRAAGVNLNGAGTLELTSLLHHESDENKDEDTRNEQQIMAEPPRRGTQEHTLQTKLTIPSR
jgi:hypothetical protein